jgi:fatty acid desaturase
MKRLIQSIAFLAVYVILMMVVYWGLGYYPVLIIIAFHLVLLFVVNQFLNNSHKKNDNGNEHQPEN